MTIKNESDTFAKRLRATRKEKKLGQEELALLVGISQGAISKLERAEAVKTTEILLIAGALEVNPYWLEFGKGAKNGCCKNINEVTKKVSKKT